MMFFHSFTQTLTLQCAVQFSKQLIVHVHLSGKFRQNKSSSVDFRVVISKVHALNLIARQLPHWLTKIYFLQKVKYKSVRETHSHLCTHTNSLSHTTLYRRGVHRVFTAEHEADLAARIRRDGAVSIVHNREERLAEDAHFFDQLQVQPLTLSCKKSKRSITSDQTF